MYFDVGVKRLWECWCAFQRGKKRSAAIEMFAYSLEENLFSLSRELTVGTYRHGSYRRFVVTDSKRREIAVAGVRDRIVHRLIYEYLVTIFDRIFFYDIWSCRTEKGLLGAIERTQNFSCRFPRAFVWRGDIHKFFDSVDTKLLYSFLCRRVADIRARHVIQRILDSYKTKAGTGIPIGNLTSQIFANIYLNEIDRYVAHVIKPLGYVRYGDDMVIFTRTNLEAVRIEEALCYELSLLGLGLNSGNTIICKAHQGIRFLGCWIYPRGRTLQSRARARAHKRLSFQNAASYSALIEAHEPLRCTRQFPWHILEVIL